MYWGIPQIFWGLVKFDLCGSKTSFLTVGYLVRASGGLPVKKAPSLSHTERDNMYHVVCIPKYRQKVLYGNYGIIGVMCFTNWHGNAKSG